MMFFRKPKGWAELSKEDQAWAKTLKKGYISSRLEECARNNQVSRLRYILDNNDTYNLDNSHFKKAISEAVQNRSTEALKLIYEYRGWDAGYTQAVIITAIKNKSTGALKLIYESVGKKESAFYDTWKQSFGVFTAASEVKSKECWDIVLAGNDALPPRLRTLPEDIAEIAVNHGFPEAYNEILGKKAGPDDTIFFEKAMKAAVQKSPVAMHNVLWWKDRFHGAPTVMADVLCKVAAEGKISMAEMLLGAGVDVNHGKGRALKAAANNGQLEMVRFLVEKGADVRAYGGDLIPALFNGSDPQLAVAQYLDSFFDGRYRRAHIEEGAKADENKNFALAGSDTLAEKKPLPFGGTLTILFNFALRQQTVIAQDATAKKESMALQVINFSDIENEALDRAAKKFVELGGDPKMTEELKIRKTGLTRD
ncbi:MAG: hypothetical protein K8R48_03405 [Alphaproteobacteria bacterium]|nr:hypothetical protein [Alphaproteobacteria bacterium]